MAAQIGTFIVTAVIEFAEAKSHQLKVSTASRTAKLEANRRSQNRVDVEYASGIEPRRRLYGRYRVAGLQALPPLVSGFTGEILHKLSVLSDGEIDSIDAYNLQNEEQILASQVDPFTGVVTGGTFEDYVRIYPHLGITPQPAEPAMLGLSGWTSAHRGDGVAYVYLEFYFNPEKYSGAPQVIFEGNGALVYIPRDDTSPGANPFDQTYYAFSKNPGEQLADFLIWPSGANVNPSRVEWDDFVEVANICDESVTVPVPADEGVGTESQARFTSSIEVYTPLTRSERDETLRRLAKAFMGVVWYSGGKWRARAGVYSTPVGSITDDDLGPGRVSIAAGTPRSSGDRFNTVRGVYVEEKELCQEKGVPEVSSSSFVTEDGEVIHTNIDYLTCRDKFEAQRDAMIDLFTSRNNVEVSATFKFRCYKFQLYDIVTVTLSKVGWVNQTARIIRHVTRSNFTVVMTLLKVNAADYDDPDIADYANPNDVPPPASSSYRPSAPQNLRATPMASAILFEWDPPIDAPIGVLYLLYEHTSPNPFASAVPVSTETPQTSLIIARSDSSLRYYWITARDPAGGTSGNAPPLNGIPAAPASASSALSALVVPGSATATTFSTSVTTNSVTVTATGGTPGYTYNWTFSAGGTGITITSSTSAATTFSASSLSEGDSLSGTATCTVTDGLGATATASVTVTIERLFTVTMLDRTISSTGGSMSAAASSVTIGSNGMVDVTAPATSYQWKDPAADSADYDARLTLTSGSLTYHITGWVHLAGASASVAVAVRTPSAGPGTSTQTVNGEIRDHASLAVLGTATFILNETII